MKLVTYRVLVDNARGSMVTECYAYQLDSYVADAVAVGAKLGDITIKVVSMIEQPTPKPPPWATPLIDEREVMKRLRQ